MKPRIVILSAFATPFRSGAEACSEEIPPLLSHEFDFTIVTARLRKTLPKSDRLESGIPVVRVGIGTAADKWLFPFLAPFAVRKLKPQIVHAVLESFAGMALVLCKVIVPRAKRVLTLQSTNTDTLLKPMHAVAHRLTAISSVLIRRARLFNRNDVSLIPNGIHIDPIITAMQNFPKCPGRILFVGRLESMKGVDTLLKAFGLLLESADRTDFNLLLHVVGGGSLRIPLEQLAMELGIRERVTFTGYLSPREVSREFAEADIFCGLSRSEALGNVFLEAQAAECAVIGTAVGGIPEIVKDGESGILVPPDDPRAAAKVIEGLLLNRREADRLKKNARQVSLAYEWKTIARRYADVYRSLLG